MEYLAYSLMDSAYAEATADTEIDLPELKLTFSWKSYFKSAWLTFTSISLLLAIFAQAQVATAANGQQPLGNNQTPAYYNNPEWYMETGSNGRLIRLTRNLRPVRLAQNFDTFETLNENDFPIMEDVPTALPNRSSMNRWYNVRTNGSCLNIRTGPNARFPTVACYKNGSRLPQVVGFRDGFAQLAQGYYVSTRWIAPRTETTPTPSVSNSVLLRPGSRGVAVARLQRYLGVTPTGVYGPTTTSTVRRFQISNGLLADGIAGPQTLATLGYYSG